jgi:hypothetical protein
MMHNRNKIANVYSALRFEIFRIDPVNYRNLAECIHLISKWINRNHRIIGNIFRFRIENCGYSVTTIFTPRWKNVLNYRWKMERQGSGTALVPNSVTTILLAARLRLKTSDWRNLH